MAVDPVCILCNQEDESIQHLFFKCSFSGGIWETILSRFYLYRKAEDWDSELAWAIGFCKGKSFKSVVARLAFAAAVYHIWLERNFRVFGGRSRCQREVLDCIEENLRLRMCMGKFPNSGVNRTICDSWHVSRRILDTSSQ